MLRARIAAMVRDVRRRILPLLSVAWRDMPAGVIVASVLINVLSLVMPLAVMQVYDRIVPRHALETLAGLILAVAGVLFAEAALRIARSHVVGWSAAQLAWAMYREMLGRLLAAPQAWCDTESASRVLDRAQALVAFAEWHGSPSRLVLIDVPFIAVFLGLMGVIGGWLVFVPIGLFLLLGFVGVMRGDELRQASIARVTDDMKIHDFLVETLTGLTTIKAGAMEPQFQRRFERLQEGVAERSARIVQIGEEAQALAGLLSNLTQMVTVTLGAIAVIHGLLSVGTLAACVLLAGRAVQPLLRALSVWNELQTVMVGLDKAAPLLELAPIQDKSDAPPTNAPLRIEMSNVTLARPDGTPILTDTSLTVPEGSILAIMGRDGSGKSTVLDLLTGRRSAQSGDVRVGGLLMPDGARSLKGRIAIVPAMPTPMQGTILENITMFRTGEEVVQAEEAARLIGLDIDIRRLPMGYDTQVSEGLTSELSTGLVQRICIARAIARHPRLLILDEANAQLDMRADQALAQGLEQLRGHVTIILITNRPSFARIADRTLVLKDGRFLAMNEPATQGAVA